MNESRGPWYLFTGLLIGLALGVLWGWYIAPVEYTDTSPASLRADYQDEFRTLIALSFLYNNDVARTQARLALLEDPDPATSLTSLAQRANAAGRPSDEVQALSRLALVAVGPPAGIPTAVPLTVFPTLTPPSSLTPTPSPSDSPAAVAQVTATETPGQATPTATQTRPPAASPTAAASRTPTPSPFPTATPVPTQGNPFILDSRLLNCLSNATFPNLVIRTLSATGNGVPGVEIILNWPGNEEHIFTGLKPEFGLGYADFQMDPGTTYTLRLADGSQLITDITPEQCDPGSGQPVWGTLDLTFVQP